MFFSRYNLPAFVELLPAPNGLTVEVGCGEGRVGRALSDLGHRVIGVDGSPLLASHALGGISGVGSFPAAVADAAALPLVEGCADLVVAFMCLQDVDDLLATVREIARVMKPGGCCGVAILHPFDTAGGFDGDDREAEFRLLRPYPKPDLYEDVVDRDGLRMVFRGWHRPLATYLNAIIGCGLMIDEVREPIPTDELVSNHPRLARQQRLPAWFHLRARKPVQSHG